MNHWYERALDWVTTKFRLNPSNWIPRLSGPRERGAADVFSVAYSIKSKEQIEDEGATGVLQLNKDDPYYYPVSNFYELMTNWLFARREAAGKDPFSGWNQLWSFLYEVSMGIYDTTSWGEPVEIVATKEDV